MLSTKQVVEQYYEAWRTGDTIKFLLAEGLTFDGPMASFSNADEYRAMAKQFAPMVAGVKILDAVYQESKAFVLLEFTTNVPQVGTWTAIDYFQVDQGKIKYSRTSYDPRKLMAFMESRV
jgi:hypothetical protein